MKNIKLCMGVGPQFGINVSEQIHLLKSVGFDGFFSVWDENIADYAKLAKENGLIFHSVHAPNSYTEKMWLSRKDAEIAISQWCKCIDDCQKNNIEIMVCHVFRGIGKEDTPTKEGIENFGYVIEYARNKNVKIAFENTEGEEYLTAIFNSYGDFDNVFFCWDTGHELCYNRGKNMMRDFGKYIVTTHLNDNMGVRDKSGIITCKDDMHLLPFDGIGDWKRIAEQLKEFNFTEILSFEVRNTFYKNDNVEEFFKTAFFCANEFSNLLR